MSFSVCFPIVLYTQLSIYNRYKLKVFGLIEGSSKWKPDCHDGLIVLDYGISS